MGKIPMNQLGRELDRVYFLVESEHSNDHQECTDYHRETLKRKVYASMDSAVAALKSWEALHPVAEDGLRYGQYGTIRCEVFEAVVQTSFVLYEGKLLQSNNSIRLGESFWESDQ